MFADNQQERLDPRWIAGFVDGEGCFHVSINRNPKSTRLGWQVLPEFRIVQHQRDEKLLQRLQRYFGCGQVVVNHGDRKELRIRGIKNLLNVVDFFQKYRLQTSKCESFDVFAKILKIMEDEKHHEMSGIIQIAKLASQMNRKTERLSRILRDYTPNKPNGLKI